MTIAIQRVTVQEFLQFPNIEESPAWELVEGIPCQKPMPTLYHSRLQKGLVAIIDNAKSSYEAFPELRCILSKNSVVPDITVVHSSRIPIKNEPLSMAPDWVIEILSPDQSTTKVIAKIQSCLEEGTQLGWLIDCEEQVVMVFWCDRPLQLLRGDVILPVLPDILLPLTVEQIFNLL